MAGSGEKWKKSKPSKYEIVDGELVRKGIPCPQPECGAGVFLGEHSDRKVCGKCGYTIKSDEEPPTRSTDHRSSEHYHL